MRQILLSIFCYGVIGTMASAQSTELFDKLIFKHGNDSLPYRLLKPVNPTAMDRFPLVIFLHGAGERGDDNESQLAHIRDLFLDTKNRGKYPCYVLAPQCPKHQVWTSGGVPAMPALLLMQLLDQIEKTFPIDKDRIYITGVSMGGFGTWNLITKNSDRFAAAVPVCGGGDEKSAATIKDIPIWAFHGALDNVVDPKQSRNMILAIQKAGGNPGYTEYPDIAHNSWVQAYQEPHLLPWLFKQSRTPKRP